MMNAAVHSKSRSAGVSNSGASTPQVQVCQRCRLPLHVHDKKDFDESAFDKMLSTSAPVTPVEPNYAPVEPNYAGDATQDMNGPIAERNGVVKSIFANGDLTGTARRTVTKRRPSSYLSQGDRREAGSFILLTDSQVANAQPSKVQIGGYESTIREAAGTDNTGNGDVDDNNSEDEKYSLSQRFETSDRLFDIVTSKVDLDQPICSECMETLVDDLKQQYLEFIRDRDAYVEFLKQVENDKPTAEEQAAAEKELAEIVRKQEQVMAELRESEEERKKVEAEIEALENQSKELSKEEERFWITRNNFSQELEDFLNERDAVKMQFQHDSELLEKLEKTNVYSDIFAIEGGHAAVDRIIGIPGKR
ncbi:autophagy protein Apg6-domain-containing protein [Lipomyces arxii]|uniref:autophagy protein Apg6-domain-containing protein n=1 Tax=Lipomyces arxii TaxID=56418 RepID=UPI0034D02175